VLNRHRHVECMRHYFEIRKFGITSSMIHSYLENKRDQERRLKEAQDNETHRRYKIFLAYLESKAVFGDTSVLKDFYSMRYR
jgi:hypothetical protein